MSPILTVIGATGVQGSSVVSHALKDGTYKVQGITRNVNSDKAKALASQGVELVTADVNDEASLIKAFEGSTAIYAVTDFFAPFAAGGPDHAIKVEVQQGINLANAASKTSTLKHYIWSTLPNGMKITNGKYLIPHFEGKNKIDEYIRNNKALFSKTTFLWVGWFASNYVFPTFTPNFLKTSGKYVHLSTASPNAPVLSIGDATKNIGVFTSAILAQPNLTLGKFVFAYVEETTTGQLLQTWSKATGKPSAYVQVVSVEDLNRLWPQWGQEMGIMMKFWEDYGDKSWSGEEVLTKKDLGLEGEKFVGIEETYKNQDWSAL